MKVFLILILFRFWTSVFFGQTSVVSQRLQHRQKSSLWKSAALQDKLREKCPEDLFFFKVRVNKDDVNGAATFVRHLSTSEKVNISQAEYACLSEAAYYRTWCWRIMLETKLKRGRLRPVVVKERRRHLKTPRALLKASKSEGIDVPSPDTSAPRGTMLRARTTAEDVG